MAETERVVVDSSAFFALVAEDDAFHQQAADYYRLLLEREQELWTTSYVLSETIALLQRRHGFESARRFSAMIEGRVRIHWVEGVLHEEAWRRLSARHGAGLNFVDWTVAVVAENMNAQIFTFDSDFSNQGYSVVPR